jgi:hypothetical protein
VDWLSFPCSVLTLKFQSELGELELDLAIRVTDMAITAILVTDTAIIHMDITDHIQTMAITRAARTTGIGFTATTVIITTVLGTKLA